jgi:hypothetical protein
VHDAEEIEKIPKQRALVKWIDAGEIKSKLQAVIARIDGNTNIFYVRIFFLPSINTLKLGLFPILSGAMDGACIRRSRTICVEQKTTMQS